MPPADSRPLPTLAGEREFAARLGGPVAGVDEAGRGPLAGPVVAAAVVFTATPPDGINDSKALTPARRAALAARIRRAARVSIAVGDVARIDADNILNATLWAMASAVAGLSPPPAGVLVDGDRAPRLAMPVKTVIGGDRSCLSIAAASIIAKVARDQIMSELDALHPGYGFAAHKGYATPAHRAALASLGPCPAHRRSFRPVAALLAR